MTISQNGLQFIASFEGFRAKPYKDISGIWTIGYGSTYDPSGKRVTQFTPSVTKDQGLQFLLTHLKGVESFIKKSVSVPLTQGQYDAICSFVYNCGSGNFQKSTLLKKLNVKDYGGACAEFIKWNKAGGKVIPGLTRRRQDEQKLFVR